MKKFEKCKVRGRNVEYVKGRLKASTQLRKMKRLDKRNGHSQRQGWEGLIPRIQDLKTKQVKVTSIDPMDKNNQRIKYVRYADQFVIGMAGSKQCAMKMKEMIKYLFEKELHFEFSDEKMRLEHLEKPISFLGYEFRKQNGVKLSFNNQQRGLKKRALSGAIKLEIPHKEISKFAIKNGYGNLDNLKITHRAKLLNNSELEILHTYNAELRGFANYYKLADNYHHLDKLFYLAESSFIKTIANKRRSTSRKVFNSMRTHRQGVLCLVGRDEYGNEKLHQFVKLKDLPKHKGAIKGQENDSMQQKNHCPML